MSFAVSRDGLSSPYLGEKYLLTTRCSRRASIPGEVPLFPIPQRFTGLARKIGLRYQASDEVLDRYCRRHANAPKKIRKR
jgi:hypothetical protein